MINSFLYPVTFLYLFRMKSSCFVNTIHTTNFDSVDCLAFTVDDRLELFNCRIGQTFSAII